MKAVFVNRLFCVFLMWSLMAPSHGRSFPDVIQLVETSTVSIGAIRGAKHKVGRFFGSGFVVADGRHVITNAHVIGDTSRLKKDEQFIVFTGKGQHVRPYPFQVVLIDEQHDLALLKFSGPQVSALVIEDSRVVRVGEQYAFTGFPIGSVLGQYPVTHKGMVSSIPPIVTPLGNARQIKPEHIKRNRDPFDVFQLDAIAYPGSSGSPLYDPETASVIGVINSVFVKGTKESVLSDPSGIAYAIPSRHVLNLLRQAGISQ